jgi:PAS domain S-box-containing protein
MFVREDRTPGLEDWIQEEIGLQDHLKVDDEGLSARRVQEWLNLRGNGLAIEGDYRPVTRRVVTSLQEGLFLNATGKVEEGTFSFLIQPMIEPLKQRLAIFGSVNTAIPAYASARLERHLLGIGGQEYGPWVKLFIKGNQGDKYPWYAGFVTFILHQATESLSDEMPIPRQLFENMPLCILVVDRTVAPGIILDVNRRAELVYGYTTAELVGHPVACLVAEESMASIHNILQCAQQGETLTTEITNRHRDNTTFPGRVVATPDPANSGRIFMAVEDITVQQQRRSVAEAIDEERLRIAREIHDGVAQDLASLRLKLSLWRDWIGSDNDRMQVELDQTQDILDAAIEEIRRSIYALRPVALDDVGLIPALQRYIADFKEQHDINIHLQIDIPKARIPAALELPLFRIFQEALNNIAKHAGASFAWVNLALEGDEAVSLTIRDNGRGFELTTLEKLKLAGHLGLKQMRERIKKAGGELTLTSQPDQGTQIRVYLPLG